MGTILRAECPCGFTSDPLFEGCGFAGPESCRDVAHCPRCKTFVSIRAGAQRRRCPRCRRVVAVVSFDETVGSEAVLRTPPVDCPACGRQTMRLTEVGLWD